MEGRCCPLAKSGYSRDGRKGTLQITYGPPCAPDGCPIAIEVFDGDTTDPMTLAVQIDKLKQRFRLEGALATSQSPRVCTTRFWRGSTDWRPCGKLRRSCRATSLPSSPWRCRSSAPGISEARALATRNPLSTRARARLAVSRAYSAA